MSTLSEIAGHLLPKVRRALSEGTSVWPVFFGYLVEASLAQPFDGMTRTPTDVQITGWLEGIPRFPKAKIGPRLERIAGFARRGVEGAAAITGDFEGWVLDLRSGK